MSAVPSSPVTGSASIASGHRLTNDQAERIAARVEWRTGDLAPWLRTLYVRAVDQSRPWVETYLTAEEKSAIVAGIEETAPRQDAPAGMVRGGGV
jgi:hypothetical protein